MSSLLAACAGNVADYVGPRSTIINEQLARYGEDSRLREYLTSRRGRSYLRMTIRNRTLVDTLIGRALGTTETDASAEASASSEGGTAESEPRPDPDPSEQSEETA